MKRRTLWQRLGRVVGEGLCVFLALSTSFCGWLPWLIGLPLGAFLVAIGAVSLVLGWRLAEETP